MQVSAHYVRPNISRNARDRTSAFFKVLSVLSEIFVFIYIGTSISMNTDAWRHGKTWSMLVRPTSGVGGDPWSDPFRQICQSQ